MYVYLNTNQYMYNYFTPYKQIQINQCNITGEMVTNDREHVLRLEVPSRISWLLWTHVIAGPRLFQLFYTLQLHITSRALYITNSFRVCCNGTKGALQSRTQIEILIQYIRQLPDCCLMTVVNIFFFQTYSRQQQAVSSYLRIVCIKERSRNC